MSAAHDVINGGKLPSVSSPDSRGNRTRSLPVSPNDGGEECFPCQCEDGVGRKARVHVAFLPQPCDELRSHVIVGASRSTPSLTLVASANVLMASQQYDGSGGADADATVALLLY